MIFSLLIINKAGGLIYNREFHTGLSKLSSNDLLILAGTFHSVHAITRRLCPSALAPQKATPTNFPIQPSGLEVLESGSFRLNCFLTHTGVKFLLITEPAQPNIEVLTKRVYEIYVDFVMRNPFYTIEMPIRCQKFDASLDSYIKARG